MEKPAGFPATHWSVVLAARDGHETGARVAWDQLCRTYWRPVYVYVRRQGCQPADAQDFTQAFFAHFLEKDYLTRLHHCEARFRSFLLTFLKRFLSDEREKAAAQKRGGGWTFVGLDEFAVEEQRLTADTSSAEHAFDRRWAMTLLERAREWLRTEYVSAGKGRLYEVLQPFLSDAEPTPAYGEAAAHLGMPENSVKSAIHRLRRRYGQRIREEIARTVETPAQIEDEIRYLRSVVVERGE